MAIVDATPRRFRALVDEYGFVIVAYLMAEADDGIDADNLASELVTRRERVFPRGASSASRTGVELNVEVGQIRPPSRESRREAERGVL